VKIHILNCGFIRIHEDLPYGCGSIMTGFRKAVMAPDRKRVTLPVFSYLIEHPALQFKTLRWVAKEANDTACAAVLCSHDKESKAETIEF
jgi:hypothetical protein